MHLISRLTEELVPVNHAHFSKWQRFYQAALLELDAPALLERVNAAEIAIFLRKQELERFDRDLKELQEMRGACDMLLLLKRQALQFASPNP
jgi:hypothetical protein